jgi:hypothetical protein
MQLTIVKLGTSSGKEAEDLHSGKSNHFELVISSMVQGDTALIAPPFPITAFSIVSKRLSPGVLNTQFGH